MNICCCVVGDGEEEACRAELSSHKERACEDHWQQVNNVCAVKGCFGVTLPDSNACANAACQAQERRIRREDRAGMANILRHYALNTTAKGMPQLNKALKGIGLQAAITHLMTLTPEQVQFYTENPAVAADNVENILSAAIAEQTEPAHDFRRKKTCCDCIYARVCGIIVSRKLAHRAEPLLFILRMILVATNGATEDIPSYLFYDRACALLYFIVGLILLGLDGQPVEITTGKGRVFTFVNVLLLLRTIVLVCDPFHYNNHHHRPYMEYVCPHYCSPNAPPDMIPVGYNYPSESLRSLHELEQVEADEEAGVQPVYQFRRIFNSERQETLAGEFNRFQNMARSMSLHHANFLLDAMVLLINEKQTRKLHYQGHDPHYIHPNDLGLLENENPYRRLEGHDALWADLQPNQQQEAANLLDLNHIDHNNHQAFANNNLPIDPNVPGAAGEFMFEN